MNKEKSLWKKMCVLRLIFAFLFFHTAISLAVGDYDIAFYDRDHFTGNYVFFTLRYPKDYFKFINLRNIQGRNWINRISSIKIGKKVGVLLQKTPPKETYQILNKDTATIQPSMNKQSAFLTIFSKSSTARAGQFPNHATGVTFANFEANTLYGNTSMSFLKLYFPPRKQLYGENLPIVRKGYLKHMWVIGNNTEVVLYFTNGSKQTFTTNNEKFKSYQINNLESLLKIEVKDPHRSGGPATPPKDRTFWKHSYGFFRKEIGNNWKEYQNGKAVYNFTEQARISQYVELKDPSRNIFVRLFDDRSMMMQPSLGPNWRPIQKGKWAPYQYPGSGPQYVVANLTGEWKNQLGMKYKINQNGSDFTWTVSAIAEKATGKILQNDKLTVSWAGPLGSGTVTGSITKKDSGWKAHEIKFSNGAIFKRVK